MAHDPSTTPLDDDAGQAEVRRAVPVWLSDQLPVGVADRLSAMPRSALAAAAVATAVLGAGLAMAATLWLVRPGPDRPSVDDVLPMATTTAPAATSTTSATVLVVHAAGAVVDPGVYRLRAGSRVVDLVEAAGGFSADADPGAVNLAAPLGDGQRVAVPRVGEAAVSPTAPGDAGGPGAGGPAVVDLNTASAAELEQLPGVGPATAAAIIDHRTRNGPFSSVDDLLDVRGIGPAKLEQLRPQARV